MEKMLCTGDEPVDQVTRETLGIHGLSMVLLQQLWELVFVIHLSGNKQVLWSDPSTAWKDDDCLQESRMTVNSPLFFPVVVEVWLIVEFEGLPSLANLWTNRFLSNNIR